MLIDIRPHLSLPANPISNGHRKVIMTPNGLLAGITIMTDLYTAALDVVSEPRLITVQFTNPPPDTWEEDHFHQDRNVYERPSKCFLDYRDYILKSRVNFLLS